MRNHIIPAGRRNRAGGKDEKGNRLAYTDANGRIIFHDQAEYKPTY